MAKLVRERYSMTEEQEKQWRFEALYLDDQQASQLRKKKCPWCGSEKLSKDGIMLHIYVHTYVIPENIAQRHHKNDPVHLN